MSTFLKPVFNTVMDAFGDLQHLFQTAYTANVLIKEFGWRSNLTQTNVAAIYSLLDIDTLINDAKVFLGKLEDKDANEIDIVESLITVIKDIFDKVNAFSGLANASLEFPFNQGQFWNQLADELPAYLIINLVRKRSPGVGGVLQFLGVFRIDYIQNTQMNRYSYHKHSINWNNFFQVFTNPNQRLANEYGWGTPAGYDSAKLIQNLVLLANGFKLKAQQTLPYYSISNDYYSDADLKAKNINSLNLFLLDTPFLGNAQGYLSLGINLLPIPDTPLSSSSPITGLALSPIVEGAIGEQIKISRDLYLQLAASFGATGTFVFELYPKRSDLKVNLANLKLDTSLTLLYKPENPLILIGAPDQTRVEVPMAFVTAEFSGTFADPEFKLKIGVGDETGNKPVLIHIEPGKGDSFIKKLLGDKPVEIEFQCTVFWSSKTGLGFNGGISFSIDIPIHKQLGPVDIESLRVAPSLNGANAKVGLGLNFSVSIGPLDLYVENIGAKAVFVNKSGASSSGVFGNLDIDWAFQSPTGIGLAIDAGSVKGGGFLNYDENTWTYTGGLELSFSKISFSAIGIVSTKLPGGKPGYSLLIIISAEFTPIQLGMGFTLNGIGGILGLNRTMNPDVLRNGIRDNTLDSILFPKDIVKNANTIISNIGQAFPAKEGQFLVGPMAKIGWGTPTLLTIELGIIIELPEPVRLAILGVIKALLPSKDNAIVKIQVNFLGIIDFTNKYLSFDASLYDSQILTFGLFGDMALRLYWGDKPNFLLSVGGFHPKFTPPPLNLPELRRLTIVLANQDNLKISVETYFAVTSNSVQFGAKVAAMAKAWKIQAIGALWFDILFQFKPFYFIADMGVMFAIKMGSKTILSLYVNLTLEGPNPWRARGKGSFKILFVKVSVSFDKTFGQARIEAIQAEAIDARVKAALINRDNWEALLPDRSHQLISWREEDLSDPNTEISVDPAGSLKISQRLIPLQTTMAKFGSSAISDFKRYDITSVMAGADTLPKQVIQDNFARNEFFYMTDDEKLSRASYELFDSGVVVGADKIDSQYAVHSQCHYEEITLDAGYRRPEPVYVLSANLFGLHRFGNYISRSGLSDFDRITTSAGPNRVKVDLQKEEFVLIDRNNMNEMSGYFNNSVDAQQFLSAQMAGSPATAANWIVANRFEL